MYDDILVATDGSDRTRGAVSHSLGLAERYDATVHALYVVDSRALSFDEDGFDESDAILHALDERGERATGAIEQRARERGLDAESAVVQGTPAREIRRYADDNDVDLVGMGTTGRSGLSRFMLGSVAESVVSKARQPVLTVNQTAAPVETPYDDILLPTDGSAHVERVADHAFDIANTYDATVHALSVMDSSLIRSRDLLAALEESSEDALDAMRARGESTGTDVVAKVWRGTPHECITTYASERDVDLVAMGAHGERGLNRFLTPTVAKRVLRRASTPVCTLRRRKDADA